MSDITLTPDTYIPSVDNRGNYIDNIPIIKNGIICLCGARKDKVYEKEVNCILCITYIMHYLYYALQL